MCDCILFFSKTVFVILIVPHDVFAFKFVLNVFTSNLPLGRGLSPLTSSGIVYIPQTTLF